MSMDRSMSKKKGGGREIICDMCGYNEVKYSRLQLSVKEGRQNLALRMVFGGDHVNVNVLVNVNVPEIALVTGTFTFTSTFTEQPSHIIRDSRFCRVSLTGLILSVSDSVAPNSGNFGSLRTTAAGRRLASCVGHSGRRRSSLRALTSTTAALPWS